MVIFHSYVSLPEGNGYWNHKISMNDPWINSLIYSMHDIFTYKAGWFCSGKCWYILQHHGAYGECSHLNPLKNEPSKKSEVWKEGMSLERLLQHCSSCHILEFLYIYICLIMFVLSATMFSSICKYLILLQDLWWSLMSLCTWGSSWSVKPETSRGIRGWAGLSWWDLRGILQRAWAQEGSLSAGRLWSARFAPKFSCWALDQCEDAKNGWFLRTKKGQPELQALEVTMRSSSYHM